MHNTEIAARRSIGASARASVGPLLSTSPLLFGIPVAVGIVISVAHLLATSHPYLNWATTVNADADQLYLGHTLYQDPAVGYTGLLYTPLFPALVALLDQIKLWGGWSVLLVIAAAVSLTALVARVAFAPVVRGRGVTRILAAAGIGAIAYWCVSSMEIPALQEARPDQVAWAFALFGLVAVADFGPAPPRRRVALAVTLLTAGFWAKQSTIGVAVLCVVWVIGLAAVSALNRRTAWLFTAALVGVNTAILLILNLLTHGWEFYISFEMPLAQPTKSNYWPLITNGWHAILLALVFVGVAWSATVTAAGRRRWRAPRGPLKLLTAKDPAARRALLFGLYAVAGFVLAVYFRRKYAAENNHFIGVVWTLGLLAAVGWCVAQQNAGTAAIAGGCVALFFALTQLGPIRALAVDAGTVVPTLAHASTWEEVPLDLRSWASEHTLYTPEFSELNVPQGGPLYPDYYDIADLLAAGQQPMYLVKALLNRDFEGVEPFYINTPYTSGYGKWEENYIWKLDQVIAARYYPAPGLPGGVWARRPGPERAVWMRHCFGPFAASGTSFRIGRGGGFWCSFSPSRLELVLTPSAVSEVLTTQPMRASGTMTVSLAPQARGPVYLALEHERAPFWTARIERQPARPSHLVVTTYLHGAPLGSATVSAIGLNGHRYGLKLELTELAGRPGAPRPAGADAVALTAPATSATLALLAGSGTEIDLTAMRFGE